MFYALYLLLHSIIFEFLKVVISNSKLFRARPGLLAHISKIGNEWSFRNVNSIADLKFFFSSNFVFGNRQ